MAATAGELRHKIDLQVRSLVDDGYGNEIAGPFETQATVRAKFHFLRGGEEVFAGRLAGKQPAIITVRQNAATRALTPSWRIVTSDGAEWNIRSIADPDGRRAWLEILAEKGVAT
ncbi:phage head closure protein [Rhizobium mesoamericanum]|uniref:Phage-related protein n=1 Tax=Rhizobium mesoamericanum STM3625 TaxID=1211777 RepID=K0PXZ4_9HYPH|nr:phage head closure protein [Rhizobium mesoamericanum]CCM76262.1 Phage-related protein [Rhizobium mesoamericanum STM3625]